MKFNVECGLNKNRNIFINLDKFLLDPTVILSDEIRIKLWGEEMTQEEKDWSLKVGKWKKGKGIEEEQERDSSRERDCDALCYPNKSLSHSLLLSGCHYKKEKKET